jgi:hypothetical protein
LKSPNTKKMLKMKSAPQSLLKTKGEKSAPQSLLKTNELSNSRDELLKGKEIDVEREAEEMMHSEFQSEIRPGVCEAQYLTYRRNRDDNAKKISGAGCKRRRRCWNDERRERVGSGQQASRPPQPDQSLLYRF